MHRSMPRVTAETAQALLQRAPHITIKPLCAASFKYLSHMLPSAEPTQAVFFNYTIKSYSFKPLFQFTALMHLSIRFRRHRRYTRTAPPIQAALHSITNTKNGPPPGSPSRFFKNCQIYVLEMISLCICRMEQVMSLFTSRLAEILTINMIHNNRVLMRLSDSKSFVL